ncbi:MAG: hypothetical protein CM1200mP2_40710 [Planctomycetaceae bacterium]|nr:MAG: hypothetical protein CM1200mP2_40710 [Planctomycetaceae bacterium]
MQFAVCVRKMGDDVAIIGKTMGPWTLGYHVFGVEPFLLMSLDDPGHTKLCLDRMKEITVAFGQAQIDAGADALTLPDHATGPGQWRVLPGISPGSPYGTGRRDSHSLDPPYCGRTVDRMDYIAQTGLAAFHYDSKNDPAESRENLYGSIALSATSTTRKLVSQRAPNRLPKKWFEPGCGRSVGGAGVCDPFQTAIENLKEIPLAGAQSGTPIETLRHQPRRRPRPMSAFLDRIARGDVLISDGATGTYLQQNGLDQVGVRRSSIRTTRK